jgi:hypothetical protein
MNFALLALVGRWIWLLWLLFGYLVAMVVVGIMGILWNCSMLNFKCLNE